MIEMRAPMMVIYMSMMTMKCLNSYRMMSHDPYKASHLY